MKPVRQCSDDDIHVVPFERVAVVCDEIDIRVPILPRSGGILSRLGNDFDLGARRLFHDVNVTATDPAGAQHRNSKRHAPQSCFLFSWSSHIQTLSAQCEGNDTSHRRNLRRHRIAE